MRESSAVYYTPYKKGLPWAHEDVYHIMDVQVGQPASVEFDFLKIWKLYKKYQLDVDRINFIHVHPPGVSTDCSLTDLNCIEGFKQAFGSDQFYFIIITFENDRPDSIDGVNTLHYYENGIKYEMITDNTRRIIPLNIMLMLKSLSYKE